MIRKILTCFLFVGAGLFLAHTSGAFTFMDPGYRGPYIMKLQNWDMGTLYQSPGIGIEVGGSGDNAADATAVNAITAVPATGAYPSVTLPGFEEDIWAIANITELRSDGGTLLWQQGYLGENVSAIVYGAVDTYFQETAQDMWHINAVGLRLDVWLDVGPVTPLDVTPGSAGRTAVDQYATATDGTLILTLESTPGFLNQAGDFGGPNAEFLSLFDADNRTGEGVSHLNVTGGTMASFFDTNTISNNNSLANGVPNADLWMQFTTTPIELDDWLLASNDPVRGYYIPEPASLGMLGFGLVIMLARRRRR